jgi:Neutral/alkaline non-lysosomal ceramidase, N-terminal
MHRVNAGLALIAAIALVAACDSDPTPTTPDGQVMDLAVGDLALDQSAPDAPITPDGPVTDAVAPDAPTPDTVAPKLLKAGAAAVEITPDLKSAAPLAGFGGAPRRNFTLTNIPAHLAAALGACYDPDPKNGITSLFEPSTGKHDPIMARAVVLDNGVTKAAIVKIDSIGVTRKFYDDIGKEAVKLGIPQQNLMVAGTHTHSGPGAVSTHQLFQLVATDCFHPPTYQAMLAKIIVALKQANAALTPAAIGVDSASDARISRNRMIKGGAVDTELGLIKIVDATSGKPIAAVINYAVHGTCLGSSNMLYSADLMGYAENAIEKTLGGGVALFINGAEGDVAPDKSGFAGAALLGGYLAETTGKLWPKVSTKPWIAIEGSFSDVKMPAASYPGCVPLFGDSKTLCDYIPGLSLPIGQWMQKVLPFAALRLDDVVLATVPGEPTTAIGQQIKAAGKAQGFRKSYVVGLANDHMGYITTPTEYTNKGYEAQSTLYGSQTGTIVVNAAKAAINAVTPTSWPDAGPGPADAGVD